MTETNIQLNIRPFEPADEAAVIDLWHRCGLVVPWNDPKTDIALKLDFQPELLLVGTLNNSVVATVMVGYEGHRGWINYLAVSPDHQSQGIGRRMMEEAESKLREIGSISRSVRPTNPSSPSTSIWASPTIT